LPELRESVAGRLYPDLREHGVLAVWCQRKSISERLGNGLYRKKLAGVTLVTLPAVGISM
jgi:hypothetical protein